MSNLLTAQVTIEGIRPILWHAFGPDSMPVEKREKTGVAGHDPEEWKRSVLMTTERQLFIKPNYVYSCIREGGRNIKQGRGNMLGTISNTLQVMDSIILVDRFVPEEPVPTDSEQPVYIDISGVKNPVTKGRNIRYRIAAAPGWHLTFNIVWDKTIVARDVMREAIKYAGQLVGLGDGRSIGNGRFVVQGLDVQDA